MTSRKERPGRLRAPLAELSAALETDRALRLGSPPPSAEQLSDSTALIRQQVNDLQGVLGRPPPAVHLLDTDPTLDAGCAARP